MSSGSTPFINVIIICIFIRLCLIDYDPFQVQKERSLNESLEQMKVIGLQLLEFVQKPSLIKGAFEQFLLVINMSIIQTLQYFLLALPMG